MSGGRERQIECTDQPGRVVAERWNRVDHAHGGGLYAPRVVVAVLAIAPLAVSLGGDSDTLACIAGSVAEALFGIAPWIEAGVRPYLTDDIRAVVDRFRERFMAGHEPPGS